jgi:hypothetical protein
MSLSSGEAQTLAAALLQLNALLGLSLIWTETRLQQRDKEQAGNQRKREPRSQKRTSGNSGPATTSGQIQKNEWFLFVIFIHSITWSIFAIALPRTFTVDISLGISTIWLQISAERIIRAIVVSNSNDRKLFKLVLATTWTPLFLLILLIRVGSK